MSFSMSYMRIHDAGWAEKRLAYIERVCLPDRVYEANDFLERGGYWQQQSHIYRTPFYYIDYALARICSLHLAKIAIGLSSNLGGLPQTLQTRRDQAVLGIGGSRKFNFSV